MVRPIIGAELTRRTNVELSRSFPFKKLFNPISYRQKFQGGGRFN